MNPQQLFDLRKPFPPESVGKLPKSTCRACSNAQNRKCSTHAWVTRCEECHGQHSTAVIHLDYVGHAAVTERLLTVDPHWKWEPFALGEDGLPATDKAGNLWIRLTIHDVTRIGVGDGKNAKELIGDALRNAAMRFGVALDLWAKDDLVEFSEASASGKLARTVAAADFAAAPPAADPPQPQKRRPAKKAVTPDAPTAR